MQMKNKNLSKNDEKARYQNHNKVVEKAQVTIEEKRMIISAVKVKIRPSLIINCRNYESKKSNFIYLKLK